MIGTLKLIYAYMAFVSYVPFPTHALLGILGIIFNTAPAMFNIFVTPFLNVLLSYLFKLYLAAKHPTLV
jgi:hypothetical protein